MYRPKFRAGVLYTIPGACTGIYSGPKFGTVLFQLIVLPPSTAARLDGALGGHLGSGGRISLNGDAS